MRFRYLRIAAIFIFLTCGIHRAANADCAGPAGPAGRAIFNDDYNVLQYCDGTNWIAMGFAPTGGGGSCTAGDTWTARDSDREWAGITSSSDGTKLAAVDNGTGKIYTSTDSGATWTARATNQDWQAIASSSDGTKLAAAINTGAIYTSSDSGVTWGIQAGAGSRSWTGIAMSSDGTKLVASPYGGQIYTSTDSGVTWTARATSESWDDVAMSADGTKMAAVVEGDKIYTSTDSGATWTARDSNREWSSIVMSDDGTKLVAGVSGDDTSTIGKIYTSTDSGVTWTARDSDRNWWNVAISSDGATMAAVVSSPYGTGPGKIYTSTDSGVTWTPHESDRDWIDIAMSDDGSKMAATVEGGKIYTSECADADITTGLVGHWKLDDGTGSSTAADSSGNNNTGTLTSMDPNTDWVAGQDGGALLFDGTDKNVSLGNPAVLNMTGSMTVTAWVKFNDFLPNGNAAEILSKGIYSGTDEAFYFRTANNDCGISAVELAIKGDGYLHQICGNTVLTTGVWYHVAGVYDASGTIGTVYLNGVADGSDVAPGSMDTSSQPAQIGHAGSIAFFDGIIDDVRIYNRVLSAADVAALYAGGGGSCTGPSALAGNMFYNAASHVPQYCDGTQWVAMGPVPGPGDGALPTVVTMDMAATGGDGLMTWQVPAGIGSVQIEAWGAGGGGGVGGTAAARRSGGGGGGSGVERASNSADLVFAGGGGGGGGAAAGTNRGGGGGGYVIASSVAVTPAEVLNVYVGGGGASGCASAANGAGGAYSGGTGVDNANASDSTFGGGGGNSNNGNGGNSIYGGGGGEASTGVGGTSTYGGAGGDAGVGFGGGFGGTVSSGSDGVTTTGGAGASGGGFSAGSGANGNTCATAGGNGQVKISYTVHPQDACTGPDAPEGRIIYNVDYNVLQYCDGQDWRAIGK